MAEKKLTDGQRAYEAKRAAKAGMSLEKWLSQKEKRERAEEEAASKAARAATEEVKPKKTGFFSRLMEKATKPL
ncbi:hypothetical protein [Plastoroseomonas arctica]|uniref:Uncharacterized protein n=1 Tax=Plastoroseomonas arctica TaxID=1509237 RepID=A0AAF1KMC9_9PROT|nr:hypothetical protein [Plastoroseomonas arctica]MBR0656216.1 hypothetical protein [Plastoroseomonas arctica]